MAKLLRRPRLGQQIMAIQLLKGHQRGWLYRLGLLLQNNYGMQRLKLLLNRQVESCMFFKACKLI